MPQCKLFGETSAGLLDPIDTVEKATSLIPKPISTKPCTIIYVRYRTTNTGTLPSTRTSDV